MKKKPTKPLRKRPPAPSSDTRGLPLLSNVAVAAMASLARSLDNFSLMQDGEFRPGVTVSAAGGASMSDVRQATQLDTLSNEFDSTLEYLMQTAGKMHAAVERLGGIPPADPKNSTDGGGSPGSSAFTAGMNICACNACAASPVICARMWIDSLS